MLNVWVLSVYTYYAKEIDRLRGYVDHYVGLIELFEGVTYYLPHQISSP